MLKKFLKHHLTWIILIGFLFRFYGFLKFPVLHDEIMSILDGVKKTRISLVNFFFKSSLENCLGITPLYFWVERFFVEIFGENNIGLRFFPLLSGIFTPILAYFVIKKYFPEKIALFSSIFVTFSSNFIWSTSKSQYFEVLILPILFLIFYFLFSQRKNKFLFVSFFFFLIFFTYFGKALALFLTFFAWYLLMKFFEFSWQRKNFNELKKEIIQLFSFFIILFIWIALAQFFVFANEPIESAVGLGKVENIGKMILLTTFGYGIASKQFLSGSQRGAFLIFNDIKIWPTETLLFVPFLIGLVATVKNLIQNLKEKSIEELKMNSFLLICTILPLVYIYSLGLISARFHFLYFVPFVIICALGLEEIFKLFKENKIFSLLILFFLAIYISCTSSWENWYYKVFNLDKFLILFSSLFFIFLIYLLIYRKISQTIIKNIGLSLIFLSIILANLFFGPFVWGKNAEWEPAFDNKLKPCPNCYAEKNEEELINFAIMKKNPKICQKLPEDYKNICLESFK